MTVQDALSIAATFLVSLGGGAAIVFGLSSWLGKVWANRIMTADRARHAEDLERLRASLSSENDQRMRQMETGLEIYKDRFLKAHHDKVATYRMATDIIASLLAELDRAHRLTPDQAALIVDTFNRDRIRLYGYLGMLAPQSVMDAQDALIDYLLLVVHGNAKYEWARVRAFALAVLNEIRKDIGIDTDSIQYRGAL